LEYSEIHYSIQLPEKGKNIMLTNEQRRNILLATKEIVNNAIKHSGATNISIKAELNNGNFTCIVEDNGNGFNVSQQYSGNGLKNIRHRVEESGGQLEIKSEPGKGSRFVYNIPIKTTT
jgi:signal transduction histidine kinase